MQALPTAGWVSQSLQESEAVWSRMLDSRLVVFQHSLGSPIGRKRVSRYPIGQPGDARDIAWTPEACDMAAHRQPLKQSGSKFHMEMLEHRIYFSADSAFAVLYGSSGAADEVLVEISPAHPGVDLQRTERSGEAQPGVLVLLDSALSDLPEWLEEPEASNGDTMTTVVLNARSDPLTAIGAVLAGQRDLSAVHLVSQGGKGVLQLGGQSVDILELLARAEELAQWRSALAPGADFRIHGLHETTDESGRQWADTLARLTGAAVSTTSAITGVAELQSDKQATLRANGVDGVFESQDSPVHLGSTGQARASAGSAVNDQPPPISEDNSRLLHSADLPDGSLQHGWREPRELLFIASDVADYRLLLDGLDSDTEVHFLNTERDGIDQIVEVLAGRSGIEAIHLVGEGAQAQLHLGSSFLTQHSISERYAEQLKTIGESLVEGADLLIYGCNFGEGKVGRTAMDTLARLTGADIAASSDRTGHINESGNWMLEVQTGSIEAAEFIGRQARLSWTHALATFTVSNTSDAGTGSLRWAINQANSTAGTDRIAFNIPGGGSHTIVLSSSLPVIQDAVTIDGTTQPGWVDQSYMPIVIDGDSLNSSLSGFQFRLDASNSEIRGLIIRNFETHPIAIQAGASGVTVAGNWIGSFDSDGSRIANLDNNHWVSIDGHDNIIGGDSAVDRNVIHGFDAAALRIQGSGAYGNVVSGNYFGTTIDGNADFASASSFPDETLWIRNGASSNTIGGATAAHGNIFGGANQSSIALEGTASTGNKILSNTFGLGADGVSLLHMGNYGVLLEEGRNNVVGEAGSGNTFVGDSTASAFIHLFYADETAIQGNFLGTDSSGSINGGASTALLIHGSSEVSVGGTGAGEGNVITNSSGAGVGISHFDNPTGISIRGNSLFGNDELGIDLNADSTWGTNDAGDLDDGANSSQNWAVVNSASIDNLNVFTYDIDTTTLSPGAYTIDFYASTDLDAGQVEGKRFLGTISTVANGNSSLTGSLSGVTLVEGEYVTLVTTDSSTNSSSEFSNYAIAVEVFSIPPDIHISSTTSGGLSINADGGNDIYLLADDGGALLNGLDSLSVEVRLSLLPSSAEVPLISYATGTNDDELKLLGESGGSLNIQLAGSEVTSTGFDYLSLRDGKAHSLGLTWESSTGYWAIYVDGELADSTDRSGGSLLAQGRTMDGGGVLLFGQEQDAVEGGFQSGQTLSGTLFHARLFGDVRTPAEMASSHRSKLIFKEEGMLAQWSFDSLSSNDVVLDSVRGNNLSLRHVSQSGFSPSEASLSFRVNEQASNGTVLGRVSGTDPERVAEIAALFAADPELRFSAETGKFYKPVLADVSYTAATSAAVNTTLNGVAGQLLTVRSATEQAILIELRHVLDDAIWLGGNDLAEDGRWVWQTGEADGDQFWQGESSGYPIDNAYSHWGEIEPNNHNRAESYLRTGSSDGRWNDTLNSSRSSYVVEWSADEVLNTSQALSYAITSQTVAGSFSINSDTGVVSVLDGALLDDQHATHVLTVQSTDADSNTVEKNLTVALEELTRDARLPVDLSSGIELNKDGGNDALLFTTNAQEILGGLGAFTLEALFSGVVSQGNSGYSLVSYATDQSNDALRLDLAATGAINLTLNGVMSTSFTGEDYVSRLLDGERHHVALGWDNSIGLVHLYIDGVLIESKTGFAVGATLSGSANSAIVLGNHQGEIGGLYDPDTEFSGTYYGFRIWDQLRLESDVALNHRHSFQGGAVPSGLLVDWQMNGLNGGNEVVDRVSGNNLRIGDAGDSVPWAASEVGTDLHVVEDASDGTSIGHVVPGTAYPLRNIVSDGLFIGAGDGGGIGHSEYWQGQSFGAWSVESGSIDLIHTFFESPYAGGQSVDLSGNTDAGAISQEVMTESGRQYQLAFWVSGNWDGGPDVKPMRVSVGGESHEIVLTEPTGWAASEMRWERRVINFIAEDDTTDIFFMSLVPSAYGPVIGNVQVIELPQAVDTLLREDLSLSYLPEAGKLYRVVDTTTDWVQAHSAATSTTLNGVSGQLVTIRSSIENDWIRSLAQGASSARIWTGGSTVDAGSSARWYSAGQPGQEIGVGESHFSHYAVGEPASTPAQASISLEASSGSWYQTPATESYSYIVEWDALDVLGAYEFSLADDAGGRFAINEQTGKVIVADGNSIDHEQQSVHGIDIRVSNAAGLSYLETVLINVDPVNEAPAFTLPERVSNGGFDIGLTGWAPSGQVEHAAGELRFGSGDTTGPHSASQNFATVAGGTYELEFDYRDGDATRNQTLQVSVDGVDNLLTTAPIVSDVQGSTYERYRYTFTADSDNATLRFADISDTAGLSNTTLGVDGYLDNVSVRYLSGLMGRVPFTEAEDAVVLDSVVELFDDELGSRDDFGGSTLTLERDSGGNAEDVFSATGNLTFEGSDTGNMALLSGTVVGTYSQSGGALTLAFAQGVTNAQVNEVMQSLAYENTSTVPPESVKIAWRFNDQNTGTSQGAGGALTGSGYTLVEIAGVSNAAITDAHYTTWLGDDEFTVNTHVVDNQQDASLAVLPDGGFVVAWESFNQDGSGDGIYFQRFDSFGSPQGAETRASVTSALNQRNVSTATLADGRFAISWESNGQDGSEYGVVGRLFSVDGVAQTGEFLINTSSVGDQSNVSLAALADGGFVAVYQSALNDGDGSGIYFQLFDSAGNKQGGETQANIGTVAGEQRNPDVTVLSSGDIIIAWDDIDTAKINAQRFDASGLVKGSEFRVNATTSSAQSNPRIAALASGGFVVVWESNGQDGDAEGVYMQRYTATAEAEGGEALVNSTTVLAQRSPDVATLPDGGYVVVWESTTAQDGETTGIFAQQFDPDGNRINGQFQLDRPANGDQNNPAVKVLEDGQLVAVWDSENHDGDGDAVMGRLFSQSLKENAPVGTLAAVLSQVVDADTGEAYSYALLDDAQGTFAIDSDTGAITVLDPHLLDHEVTRSVDVTVRITDPAAYTHDEVVSISLENVAEAKHAVPDSLTVSEGSVLLFSGADQISVTDTIASSDEVMQVSLSVQNGVIKLADLTGITMLEGADNSASLTFYGRESDINEALAGSTFTPDSDFIGSVALSMTSSLAADLDAYYTFDGGNANDQSISGLHDGSLNGDAVIVNDPVRGDVLSLDGDGDLVKIDGLLGQPESVTLSTWINASDIDTYGGVLISLGSSPALYLNASGYPEAYYRGDVSNVVSGSESLIGSGWRHVALTLDNDTKSFALYIDGNEAGRITGSGEPDYNISPNTYIGRHGDGSAAYQFAGLVDDVRIYGRALSAGEVAALATDRSSSASESTITVQAVNDPVVAVSDTDDAIEAGGVNNTLPGLNPSGNVLVNDTDSDAGDTKTVVGVQPGIQPVTQGAVGASVASVYGSVLIASNGDYTYTVDNDNVSVQSLLDANDSLTDTFSYTVRDTGGEESTAQLVITITGQNDAADQIIPAIYLSDLAPAAVVDIEGGLQIDQSSGGNAIVLDGMVFSKGIGTQAPVGGLGYVEYDTQGADRFKAVLGISDHAGSGSDGSVIFRAYLDGVLHYSSTVLTQMSRPVGLDLPVSGASTIRLEVDAFGGNDTDHAVWANARFESANVPLSVDENATGGTIVGSVSHLDADWGDNASYALANNSDGRFAINAGTGEITVLEGARLDHEYLDSLSVTVKATDAGGLTVTDEVLINVSDVNEAPVITSGGGDTAAVVVEENQRAVITMTSLDEDGDRLGYWIVGGADRGAFAIDESSGELTFINAPDFESPGDAADRNQYDVIIQVSDSAGSEDRQRIAVTVTDVNEAPVVELGVVDGGVVDNTVDTSVLSVSVAENTDSGMRVVAVDEDADAVLSYSLSGGEDQAAFTVDAISGVVRFVEPPDFERKTRYEVELTVTDNGGLSAVQSLVFGIQDINEPPEAVEDRLESVEGQTIAIDPQLSLLNNDTDPENDALALVGFQQPEHGTLVQNDQGLLVYKPDDHFVGLDRFYYEVEDSDGHRVKALVSLEVMAMADPIQAAAKPDEANSNGEASLPENTITQEVSTSESANTASTASATATRVPVSDVPVRQIEASAFEVGGNNGQPQMVTVFSNSAGVQEARVPANTQSPGLPAVSQLLQQLLDYKLAEVHDSFGLIEAEYHYSAELHHAIMELRDQVDDGFDQQVIAQLVVTYAPTVVGSAMAVAAASWVLQSGLLLSATITMAPLWRPFDPVPVLVSSEEDTPLGQ